VARQRPVPGMRLGCLSYFHGFHEERGGSRLLVMITLYAKEVEKRGVEIRVLGPYC
jgi:hypothetical protein